MSSAPSEQEGVADGALDLVVGPIGVTRAHRSPGRETEGALSLVRLSNRAD